MDKIKCFSTPTCLHPSPALLSQSPAMRKYLSNECHVPATYKSSGVWMGAYERAVCGLEEDREPLHALNLSFYKGTITYFSSGFLTSHHFHIEHCVHDGSINLRASRIKPILM